MDFFRSPLVRFLAGHLAVGIAAGWSVLAVLLWLDVAGLRSLIVGSGDGAIAIAMLATFFALTFGSLAMGTGVMSLARRETDGHSRGRRAAAERLPLPARIAGRRRR
jgi:hypothetical protein